MNWEENWDPQVGLWWTEEKKGGFAWMEAGVTRYHSTRESLYRLLLAAQLGRLHELPAAQVIVAIRGLQRRDPGPQFGGLPGSAESRGADEFFTLHALLLLFAHYSDRLPAPAVAALRDIFRDGIHWYRAHAAKPDAMNYPNMHLGPRICYWLLAEIEASEEDLAKASSYLRTSGEYYLEGWGFGEHLSDNYARLLLDEISTLLVTARRLPTDLRDLYLRMLNDLIGIEDLYDGGPHVPQIRSYDFVGSPHLTRRYRRTVRPFAIEEAAGLWREHIRQLGALWHEKGWHRLVNPPRPRQAQGAIHCFGGAKATAAIESDIRLGSLSRFPNMINTGLDWQSFPVALWRPEGDWGFLQWSVQEDGRAIGHPSLEPESGALPRLLSKAVSPAPQGRTAALQRGGDVLVFRMMPTLVTTWAGLSDSFRLVNGHAQLTLGPSSERWSQMLLAYPERQVSVHHVQILPDLYPSWKQPPELRQAAPNISDWIVTLPQARLANGTAFWLWAFSLGGEVREPPRIRAWRDGRTPEMFWDIDWKWPNTHWKVRVDPHAAEPLREIAATC